MESKLDNALDTNSRDIPRAHIGGRQGAESILIFIILRTTLKIRELDA